MEIILLEKVSNLGALGAKVNVKPGYGRNFLIPYGKAVPATKANLEAFEARVAVVIAAKSGDEGKLFGSVGTRDIADAITAAGVAVDKLEVRLPNGALRNTGVYTIALHLHSDVVAQVSLTIVSE